MAGENVIPISVTASQALAELSKIEKSLNSVAKESRSTQASVTGMEAAVEKAGKTLQNQTNRLDALTRSNRELRREFTSMSTGVAGLTASVDKAVARFRSLESSQKSLLNTAAQMSIAQTNYGRKLLQTITQMSKTEASTARAAQAQARYNAEALRMVQQSSALGAALQQRVSSLEKQVRAMQQATTARQQLTAEEEKGQKTIRSSINSTNSLSDSFGRLATAVLGFIAAYAGIHTLKNIAGAAIQIDSLNKSFAAIQGSVTGAGREMEYVSKTAQRLGLDFTALSQSYKGFSAATKFAHMELAQSREIFTSVSEAATVLGLSGEKTQLVLMALEQMVSKGVVSMEELRRQLGDSLPGAFELGAKAMGMGLQEFNKFVASGQLLTEEFLPKFAKVIKETFSGGLVAAIETPRAAIQRLANDVVFAKNLIGGAGFLSGLKEAAERLHSAFNSQVAQQNLVALGKTLGEVVGLFGKLAASVLESETAVKALQAAIVALAAIIAASGIAKLVSFLATANPAIKALTAAVMAVSAAYALFSDETDLATQLVAKYKTSTEDAAKSLLAFAASHDKLSKEQQQQLSREKQVAELREQQTKVIEAHNDLERVAIELQKQEYNVGVNAREVRGELLGIALKEKWTDEQRAKALLTVTDAAKDQGTELRGLRDNIVEYLTTVKHSGDVVQTALKFEELSKQLDELKKKYPSQIEAIKELEKAFMQASNPILFIVQSLELLRQGLGPELAAQITEITNTAVSAYNKLTAAWNKTPQGKLSASKEKRNDVVGSKSYSALLKSDVNTQIAHMMGTEEGKSGAYGAWGVSDDGSWDFIQTLEQRNAYATALIKEQKRIGQMAKDVDADIARKNKPKGQDNEEKLTAQIAQGFLSARKEIEMTQKSVEILQAELSGNAFLEEVLKAERTLIGDKFDAESRAERLEGLRKQLLATKQYSAQVKITEEDIKKWKEQEIAAAQARYQAAVELAKLTKLTEEYSQKIELAKMQGDTKKAMQLEYDLLKKQLELRDKNKMTVEQIAIEEEKIAQSLARANLDMGKLVETGFTKLKGENWERLVKFFEESIPNAVASMSDGIATLMTDIIMGAKSATDAWEDFGKSMKQMFASLLQEWLQVQMRMLIFGGGQGGGGGGGMLGSIAGWLGGGGGGGSTDWDGYNQALIAWDQSGEGLMPEIADFTTSVGGLTGAVGGIQKLLSGDMGSIFSAAGKLLNPQTYTSLWEGVSTAYSYVSSAAETGFSYISSLFSTTATSATSSLATEASAAIVQEALDSFVVQAALQELAVESAASGTTAAASSAASSSMASTAAQALGAIAHAASVIGAAFAGYNLGSYAGTKIIGRDEAATKGAQGGAMVGAGTGAIAGAYIGSAFGPIGTAVGAFIGAAVGAIAGMFAGQGDVRKPTMRHEVRAAFGYGEGEGGPYADVNLDDNAVLQQYFGKDFARWERERPGASGGRTFWYSNDTTIVGASGEHLGGNSDGAKRLIDEIGLALFEAMQATNQWAFNTAAIMNTVTTKGTILNDDFTINTEDAIGLGLGDQFINLLKQEDPFYFYKKQTGSRLSGKGYEVLIDDMTRDVEGYFQKVFAKMDLSEIADRFNIDQSSYQGLQNFIEAIGRTNSMLAQTALMYEDTPVTQVQDQVLEMLQSVEEQYQAMIDVGVTADYATRLADDFLYGSMQKFIKEIEAGIFPASKLAQETKKLNAQFDDLAKGSMMLGATQEDLFHIEMLRVAAIRQLESSMKDSFYDSMKLESIRLAGGDTDKEQLLQSQRGDRNTTAEQFGKDSDEYALLLLVQEAQRYEYEANMLRNALSQAADNANSLAQQSDQAAQAMANAYTALVDGVRSAVESTRNGIKAAVDAWAQQAEQTYKTAANAYLNALNADLSTYKNILDSMNTLQSDLWMDSNLNNNTTVYKSAKGQLQDTYNKALAGDSTALNDFSSLAKTFLGSSMAGAGEYGEYRDDFYMVQDMINKLRGNSAEQVSELQKEIELVQQQLDAQNDTNKTLEELKQEMQNANAEYQRALTEQADAYAKWGFETTASLEQQYRDAITEWTEVQQIMNDLMLQGIITESQVSTLTVVAKLQELKAAYLESQATAAEAKKKAEEAKAAQDIANQALIDALKKQTEAAEKAKEAAEKHVPQDVGTGIYGSKYGTETELLAAKAAQMNSNPADWNQDQRDYLAQNNATTWTASLIYGFMKDIAKLDIKEWYLRHGIVEGFASGGLASGLSLVGERGPELIDLRTPGRVYTNEELAMALHTPVVGFENSTGYLMEIVSILQEQLSQGAQSKYHLQRIERSTSESRDMQEQQMFEQETDQNVAYTSGKPDWRNV